nr:immunoglobulin light chain junction region [Macaca mulatta]MOV77011.1 immunoglobulin light chain junction region [Macaca mulatta]
YMQGLEYPWTF